MLARFNFISSLNLIKPVLFLTLLFSYSNIYAYCDPNNYDCISYDEASYKLIKNVSPSFINITNPEQCPSQTSTDVLTQTCYRYVLHKFAVTNKHVGSYKNARINLFHFIDLQQVSTGDKIINSVYSDDIYDMDRGMPSDRIFNVEHSWPQSKLKLFPDFLETKADLYHLFPVESKINGKRGNIDFAECSTQEVNAFIPISKTSFLCKKGFEPPEDHKGILARAMFYMSIAYNLPIDNTQEIMFKKWNKTHPVAQAEITRMFRIAEVQGNVNPYIEHPEWIDLILDF